MPLPRILFAGPEFPAARDYLAAAFPGLSIDILSNSRLPDHHHDAEVLVPLMARINDEFLERIDGLRLVQQWGAGLEGVDCVAASARGVAVGNVSSNLSRSADSVAEWCVLAALALSRGLRTLEVEIRTGGVWGGPIGRSLAGKTAGIFGLGGIGSALARRLAPFGMDLIGVTRHPSAARAKELGLKWLKGTEARDELLQLSDYVFLCLPLVPDTASIIDETALAQLPEQACLINPGRGGLIDEDALVRTLAAGRRISVGLDVFRTEPVDPNHALLTSPAVLGTPHIGGITDSSYSGIARRFVEVLKRLAAREPLDHCVNWNDVEREFYSDRT